MSDTWLTWCNQHTGISSDCIFSRAKAVITQADIDAAIAWYEKECGVLPKQVAAYSDKFTVPEGIELIGHSPPLKWEIWLGPAQEKRKVVVIEKGVAAPPTNPPSKRHDANPAPVTPPTLPVRPAKPVNNYETPPVKPQEKAVKKMPPVQTINETTSVKPKRVRKRVWKPGPQGHQLGRPPKVGLVSRQTLWRRAKKLKKEQERLF